MAMTLTNDELRIAQQRYVSERRSLRELGREFGVTHETLRQMFIKSGLRVDRVASSARAAEDLEAKAYSMREEIRAKYRELGNLEETARELELPLKYVRVHISESDRALFTRKGQKIDEYTCDEILEGLRIAARVCGEPLTVPKYTAIAPEMGLAAPATVTSFFDGDWHQACEAAGVKANQPRGRRADAISQEDCNQALRDYYNTNRRRIPSYQRYAKWARETGHPSAGTVRSKTESGTWREALRLAFPELYG